MIVLRVLGRASFAVLRVLWKGDLMTKLVTVLGIGIALGVLSAAAGPVTTQLANAVLVLAFLFLIYSVVLRG